MGELEMQDGAGTLRIAPSRYGGHWTVVDWVNLDFSIENDWQTGITIFEDRINYRFIKEIEKIKGMPFSGFSVMALDCLLIETLKQFRQGVEETPSRKSGKYFREFFSRDTSFKDHFSQIMADRFYRQIRCGVLHQAEVKKSSRIWRRDGEPLVRYSDGGEGLFIHRNKFHNKLRDVFENYVMKLRNNDPLDEELRENFKRKMNFICRLDYE